MLETEYAQKIIEKVKPYLTGCQFIPEAPRGLNREGHFDLVVISPNKGICAVEFKIGRQNKHLKQIERGNKTGIPVFGINGSIRGKFETTGILYIEPIDKRIERLKRTIVCWIYRRLARHSYNYTPLGTIYAWAYRDTEPDLSVIGKAAAERKSLRQLCIEAMVNTFRHHRKIIDFDIMYQAFLHYYAISTAQGLYRQAVKKYKEVINDNKR